MTASAFVFFGSRSLKGARAESLRTHVRDTIVAYPATEIFFCIHRLKRATMGAMAKARAPFKIDRKVHAELVKLADENGYGLFEFAEVLLEYATRDLERVDVAIAERRARGRKASHERRRADSPDWSLEREQGHAPAEPIDHGASVK